MFDIYSSSFFIFIFRVLFFLNDMLTYHFIYGEVRLVYRIPKSKVTWNVFGSLRLKLYFVCVFDSSTMETCSIITTVLKMIR